MNKSDLIKRLTKKHPDMTSSEIASVVEIMLSQISNAIIENQRVELRGFGSFSLRKRKSRTARNPRNNEIVELPERHSIYFRAGKKLNDSVNN